ncbi:MAG: hypothetical protein OXI74_05650, partial [Rhodospirillaceae bacterium]|nr:hypothetical protein [Rhodospirillaceae bacterium]
NTVVMNSQTKRVFEVTPEAERVLDFQLPETGRPQKLQKLSLDDPGLVMLLESLEAKQRHEVGVRYTPVPVTSK